MDPVQEQQLNQAAYHRLADWINQTYPAGRFVAISGGQVVGDAERFDELRTSLRALGKDPTQALIIQAGTDHLKSVVIFAQNGGVATLPVNLEATYAGTCQDSRL